MYLQVLYPFCFLLCSRLMVRLCGPCACSTAPWSHSTSTWPRGTRWCATAPRTRPQRPKSLCTCKPRQILLHQAYIDLSKLKLRKCFFFSTSTSFFFKLKWSSYNREKKWGTLLENPFSWFVIDAFSCWVAFWMSADNVIFVSGQSHGRGGESHAVVSCIVILQWVKWNAPV